MKKTFVFLLYAIGLLVSSVMVLGCLTSAVGFGGLLRWSQPESPVQPVVVDPQELASPDYSGRLLEMHGDLKSNDVLDIPEYGVHLKATALWVDARVLRRETEPPHHSFWIPLTHAVPGAAVTAVQCPERELWSQNLSMGRYVIDSGLISRLLHERSNAGSICERSFLPLPPEQIRLPEGLQSMARLLPESQYDGPDCTVFRLAERYRHPETPTEPAREGDVELRFSYLPAEMAAAVRGRYDYGVLSCRSVRECGFAAHGRQLKPVEPSPRQRSVTPASILNGLSDFVWNFFFLLAGLTLFRISLQWMRDAVKPLRFKRLMVITLGLQLLCILVGYLMFSSSL